MKTRVFSRPQFECARNMRFAVRALSQYRNVVRPVLELETKQRLGIAGTAEISSGGKRGTK